MSEAKYREVRKRRLVEYSHVVKLKYPQALDIVGIATEARSVEVVQKILRIWTLDVGLQTTNDQRRRLKTTPFREYEYPVDESGNRRAG